MRAKKLKPTSVPAQRPIQSTVGAVGGGNEPGSRSNDIGTTISKDATFSLQLQESLQQTYNKGDEVVPAKTKATYAGPQRLFMQWCEANDNDEFSRYTVTGPKLNKFLHDTVLGRLHHSKKRKHQLTVAEDNTETADNSCGTSGVGFASVASYVAAIVDLWAKQKQRNANSNPHPREGAVSILMTTLRKEAEERRRANFIDRGTGTHLEGYGIGDFRRLANYWLDKPSEVGLRDRVAFLFCHYALLRGENMRKMELCDLHTVDLGPKEGFNESCLAVACTLKTGKTNHFGKAEYGSFMRNTDAELCPVGALALYFFSRFHMSNEEFPDFYQNSDWYDIKVLKHPNAPRTTELEYKTHVNSMTKAFERTGVVSTSKTHAPRRAGAQYAEMNGAGEDSVRRAGRWNPNALEGAYLSALPRPTMRVMAGFNAQGGNYYIARDIDVPEELQKLVFPKADYWLKAIQTVMTETGRPVRKDMAGQAFVKLLIYLRSVFWQDMITLKSRHPEHYLLQHEFFASQAFVDFESLSLSAIEQRADPIERKLQAAVPLLYEQIKNGNAAIINRLDHSETIFDAKLELLMKGMENLTKRQNKYMRLGAVIDMCHTAFEQEENAYERTDSCTMNRSINTCIDLCREWFVGVAGKAPIVQMDEEFRDNWRRTGADDKFYRRRLIIIKEVERLSLLHGIPIVAAATILDHLRKKQKKQTLHSLQEYIKNDELPAITEKDIDQILSQPA